MPIRGKVQPDGSVIVRLVLSPVLVEALNNMFPAYQQPIPHPNYPGRYTTERPFLKSQNPYGDWIERIIEEKGADIIEQFGTGQAATDLAEIEARRGNIRQSAKPVVEEQ